MDSVENIRKNKKKLLAYSIILLIVGIFIGFSATTLLKPKDVVTNNNNNDDMIVASDNSLNIEDEYSTIAKSLLDNYMGYYNKLLLSEEKLAYNNHEARRVVDDFNEIKNYFATDVTLDKLYNYYDYDNMTLSKEDNTPVYTQVNDLYYFDGACDSTSNKLSYSDFKVIEETEDTVKLNYLVSIISNVDGTTMETAATDEMVIKLEDGNWKIKTASVIGRCGFPYKIS
ncbi:MAG: hypothetical protein J6X02_02355 [Bacilli bacterium]|nr:hypothetical protein [Bacilli bacterium]